jgi:hypothetical protein
MMIRGRRDWKGRKPAAEGRPGSRCEKREQPTLSLHAQPTKRSAKIPSPATNGNVLSISLPICTCGRSLPFRASTTAWYLLRLYAEPCSLPARPLSRSRCERKRARTTSTCSAETRSRRDIFRPKQAGYRSSVPFQHNLCDKRWKVRKHSTHAIKAGHPEIQSKNGI